MNQVILLTKSLDGVDALEVPCRDWALWKELRGKVMLVSPGNRNVLTQLKRESKSKYLIAGKNE